MATTLYFTPYNNKNRTMLAMKEIERILRVDHAGEKGAIHIYKAQLLIARMLYKDIVPTLE